MINKKKRTSFNSLSVNPESNDYCSVCTLRVASLYSREVERGLLQLCRTMVPAAEPTRPWQLTEPRSTGGVRGLVARRLKIPNRTD
ncbi:hypothetical protein TNCT_678781 [Trichonephila clavata]|uniref:Uncharacterized protein n=1 Tax=Trichonephila clavata TaxID=2740835 RepID=A0A8X6G5M1_TRICU|nr:hypothetical protein TNCT_678781 [Trichonephila clavata]